MMQHATITETEAKPGQTTETTDTYTDKQTTHTVKIAKNIPTTAGTVLKDVVQCLEALKETEHELDIRITKKRGEPNLIIKTWTVSKEYYGR